MDVMLPVHKHILTKKELAEALPYLMLLKEKHSGMIKGRRCTDEQRQQIYKYKKQTSFPTVMTESVFLTSAIDALEEKYLVTVDIPGAFM